MNNEKVKKKSEITPERASSILEKKKEKKTLVFTYFWEI